MRAGLTALPPVGEHSRRLDLTCADRGSGTRTGPFRNASELLDAARHQSCGKYGLTT
jgi:hypothetical protein